MFSRIITRTYSITLFKIVLGVLAIAGAAQVNIPVKPVAISLQSMVVMAICLSYPPQLARQTVLGYIVAGIFGAPVFVNFNHGIHYVFGPTGGYVLGFWLMSVVMPYFIQKYGDSTKSVILCCTLGSLVLYVPGVLWLGYIIGYRAALYSGFILYIPSGIVKIMLLAGIRYYIKK